ncbi:hypothetical protein OGATHE_000672 [Ogataea polymorpha]|uniref:Uncharacterized protein n=1 Tax=Ogataea polymorpha TaxID=460523 RepID=A0A9P8PTD9_9ASCO|nr:hypothetical protein OGATHE_000672 [Ogataea polymorpha]
MPYSPSLFGLSLDDMLLSALSLAEYVILEMSTAPLALVYALAVVRPERKSWSGLTLEFMVLVAESVALLRMRPMSITLLASYAPRTVVPGVEEACRLLMVVRPERTSSKSYTSWRADLAVAGAGLRSTDDAASCDSSASPPSTSSS